MRHNLRRLAATGTAALLIGLAASTSPAAAAQEDKPLQAAAIEWNVIHSSQTVHNLAGMKLARLRYGHERQWDGKNTRFTYDYWFTSSTGGGWNRRGAPKITSYDTAPSQRAEAKIQATFNAQASCPDVTLYTKLVSYRDGTHKVYFDQSHTCSTTRMSTDSRANKTRAAWK